MRISVLCSLLATAVVAACANGSTEGLIPSDEIRAEEDAGSGGGDPAYATPGVTPTVRLDAGIDASPVGVGAKPTDAGPKNDPTPGRDASSDGTADAAEAGSWWTVDSGLPNQDSGPGVDPDVCDLTDPAMSVKYLASILDPNAKSCLLGASACDLPRECCAASFVCLLK
jgi:hypothetical protein